MAFPPFPSQDLAKLVLGYLAEEHLMTAYDEFLQASPYLDALRNEYDRIFMTSLKNILAEYRAVKIYVETCKPFALRKRLFQCANLFEIVKLLIQNVDIDKFNCQEQNVDKPSVNSSLQYNPSVSQKESTSLESSVETTALADLPGNVTTKRKSVKVLDKDCNNVQTVIDNESEQVDTHSAGLSSVNTDAQAVADETGQNIDRKTNKMLEDVMVKCKKAESAQKIEEFDNILDFVCKNGNESDNTTFPATDNIINHNSRISTAGTFQDFSTGIYGDSKSEATTSVQADVNAQSSMPTVTEIRQLDGAPLRRNKNNTFVNIGTINAADLKSKSHLMIKVGCIKNDHGKPVISTDPPSQMEQNLTSVNTTNTREDKKIKILSDIKVDKSYDSICMLSKMPPLLNNLTSTPHVQTQTILINGTPAYKHKTQNPLNCNYTKDEIMAMPTIILVPAPNTSSEDTHPVITLPAKNSVTSTITTSCSENILKPLVIDVTSDINAPDVNCKKSSTINNNEQKVLNEHSLIKTVEVTGPVSVPKENTLLTALKTNTPQGLPPKRKSSSTPRRTSHVRVLDFTTPRRILHETINEQSSNKKSSEDAEFSEQSDPPIKVTVEVDKNKVVTEKAANTTNPNIKNDAAKENKVLLKKKNNWDADLRALIAKDVETSNTPIQKSKNKTRSSITKKKNSDNKSGNKTMEENSKSENKTKKSSSKVKSNKNKKTTDINEETEDVIYVSKETSSIAVKPTINIITGNEWNSNQESDKNQIKNNISHERIVTPESERIALQNAIGAKLNISDFLETPYKQALYDIQMDTPKYLGPDLPDEPISDVKIMSIPTPRFLCSPKGVQATPSSYSSRPTDYSSGGSYYKPDDQDYVISTEVLEGQSDVRESVETSEKSENLCKKLEGSKEEEFKSSRPVRQCRKNVSYYNNANSSKIKEPEENLDHSDSINSSCDKLEISINSKKVRDSKRKSDSNKKSKSILLKKSKSLLKREIPKTFMKIKPRRITPIKENIGGKSRKNSDSSQQKAQKRITSKDSNLTPVAVNVPTKSRRKSSTPRKLHCTKTFNSQRSENVSPESIQSKENVAQDSQICSHDSDIEQLPLRWSDDGSQDGRSQDAQINLETVNDSDDISKIKEYIETSVTEKSVRSKDGEGSLHIDLVKRGFDVETAKIIERDLLDSPHSKPGTSSNVLNLERLDFKNDESVENNSAKTISETSVSLQVVDTDDDNNDEIELSIHECNEDTVNFINYEYVELTNTIESQPATLKENFSMEICIDDGVTVRLRATAFNMLLDQDPEGMDDSCYFKETEIAVNSILNIDKLYTPMKDPKAQVYEIFDSTLTSLDTPFKATSPKSPHVEPIVTEIELEVEKVDYKEKVDIKKRKRLQSTSVSDESLNCSKRPKSETQYLLNTANIQNIDIESVLSKLHGP